MRGKKGRILMAGGLLLLAAALCLTAYNIWDGQRAGDTAEETVQEIESLRPQQPSDPATTQENLPDYLLNPDMEMPTMEIDGHDYIGTLEIPSLGISLPVMSEWSYPNLKLSPCRFSGSAYQENLIIAGHNYKRHFGKLKQVAIGDEVRFTDATGNVFSYTAAEIEQLEPNAVEALQSGSWPLSLFTCTLGGQYRMVVRCA